MPVSTELVAFLVDQGLSGETLVQALRLADVPQRSSGAARQAKHRAKLRAEVTESDVTSLRDSDVTSPPNDIVSNPPRPSLRSETDQARKAFGEFRAEFPKRTGANPWQPAEDKFLRLVRDGVDPQQVIAGTKRYAASRAGEDPKFTCTALVFLNQRRWLDDHQPALHVRASQPRAGPQPKSDSIQAGHSYLQRKRAEREQAHSDHSPWDGPEIIPPALAFAGR